MLKRYFVLAAILGIFISIFMSKNWTPSPTVEDTLISSGSHHSGGHSGGSSHSHSSHLPLHHTSPHGYTPPSGYSTPQGIPPTYTIEDPEEPSEPGEEEPEEEPEGEIDQGLQEELENESEGEASQKVYEENMDGQPSPAPVKKKKKQKSRPLDEQIDIELKDFGIETSFSKQRERTQIEWARESAYLHHWESNLQEDLKKRAELEAKLTEILNKRPIGLDTPTPEEADVSNQLKQVNYMIKLDQSTIKMLQIGVDELNQKLQ